MPDHFHLIVEGARDESDLAHFAKTLKQLTAFRYKQQSGQRLWQSRYYDHILRASDSLDRVLWYVWLNPVRAGLCPDPHTYPYSGSFTLDWNNKMQADENWVPPMEELIADFADFVGTTFRLSLTQSDKMPGVRFPPDQDEVRAVRQQSASLWQSYIPKEIILDIFL